MNKSVMILATISLFCLTPVSNVLPLSLNPGSIPFEHCEIVLEKGVRQEYAQDIGQYYEKAYLDVGKDLGAYASKKMKLYVYTSQKSLAEGLVEFSGFSRNFADIFTKGGAPRPFNYMMHVPPGKGLGFIVHEYTHCVTEELSGKAYKHAKWLDEGLAQFEEYRVGEKGKSWPFFLVKCSLELGNFFPLEEISAEEQWVRIMTGEGNILLYREALIAVDYFTKKHGIKNALRVLELMNKNYSQNRALKRTIGIDLQEFEKEMKNWVLQVKEIQSIYAKKPKDEGPIKIDGFDDDWKNIRAVVTKPGKDVKSKIRGADIRNVYLFRDLSFLYVMFESHPSDSGNVEPISYTFYIDEQIGSKEFRTRYQPGADSTGRTWFLDFAERSNYEDLTNLRYVKEMEAEWGIKPDGTQIFEMKIPLSSVGGLETFKCYFTTSVKNKRLDVTKQTTYPE